MKLILQKGVTSQTALIFVQDSSATDGSGLTGLAYDTASLAWYYYREAQGTGGTQVTLANQTLGTWISGGFIVVDATNMPGFYEIGIPDAALASGADFVAMVLRGAADMAPVTLEIELVDIDLADGVRMGLTALPNAAAGAPGGLPISEAGELDIDTLLGRITGNVALASKLEAYVQLLARRDAAIATDRATELGEINADEGSGSGNYANTTDAQEGIRDNAPTAAATGAAAALAAIDLDHLIKTTPGAANPGTGTYLDQMMNKDDDQNHDQATDSQEAQADAATANQTTVLARLGTWTGSARNTILGAFQALFRKDADATVPSDINADLGGGAGAADNTTDSTEAIRDRGDAAWTTGGGASAAAIADAVFDENPSEHTDEDSFGNVVNNLTEEVADTYRFTANALSQAPGGAAGETYSVTFTVNDGGGSPIQGAVVSVFNNAEDEVSRVDLYSDLAGQAKVGLTDGTYKCYVWKSGYTQDGPDTVVVNGDVAANTFTCPAVSGAPTDELALDGALTVRVISGGRTSAQMTQFVRLQFLEDGIAKDCSGLTANVTAVLEKGGAAVIDHQALTPRTLTSGIYDWALPGTLAAGVYQLQCELVGTSRRASAENTPHHRQAEHLGSDHS